MPLIKPPSKPTSGPKLALLPYDCPKCGKAHFRATHALWCCDQKVEPPKALTDPHEARSQQVRRSRKALSVQSPRTSGLTPGLTDPDDILEDLVRTLMW
jgi:hypothetical protein